ncbi:MAG: N-acetylmuramoyl-L-alanine amidase [Clostridia bacterium]|nr:N-acetylmuramoyl-L-alanine amidase [Clostridia bacterium]
MMGLRRRRLLLRRILIVTTAVVLVLGIVLGAVWWFSPLRRANERVQALREATLPDYITADFIPTVGTARSGQALADFNGVVIHYVGNPATSAAANRNYFAKVGTTVVSHFVVGLDGEVIQCLPLWERSVASNNRNKDTISIEVCHPDDSGQFNAATYDAVVRLTAWLCRVGDLTTEQVIRHYDVSGKECPRYYVRNEGAWQQFLTDVHDEINK